MAGKLIARTLTAGAKPTQRAAEAVRLGFDPSRVFYHGTRSNIKEFDPKKMSKLGGNFGSGFYFSEVPEVASQFARRGMPRTPYVRNVQVGPKDPSKVVEATPSDSKVGQMIKEMKKMLGKADEPAPNVMPVHLKMENPLILQTDSIDDTLDAQRQLARMFPNAKGSDDIADVIQAAGYDSLVVKNPQGTVLESVVYKPNQIRSVYADFDPKAAKSGDVLASVDPITAGGIGALIAEGGSEAIDYVRENVTPELIRDYGLAALSVIPSPAQIPAAAASLGIMATDAANYLMDPENRAELKEIATQAPEAFDEVSQIQNYEDGGVAFNEAKAKYGNLTGIEQQTLDDITGGLQFYFRDYLNTEVPDAAGARARYQENVQEMMGAAPPAVRDYIQATNEGRMLDFLNNQQFYAEDVLPSDAAAREAVIYGGKVPYGFAERTALGSKGNYNLQGVHFDTADRSYGQSLEDVPPEIFFGGKRVGTNTPIHEGYHAASEPSRGGEEKSIRAMDYFRAKLNNDANAANDARMYLLREGIDVRKPRDLGEARMAALRVAMGIRPEFYQNLPEEAKDRFRKALEGRMETGMIASLLGGDPEFDTEGFTLPELGDMPEEQFFEMLRDAPAFTEDGRGSYDYLRYEGPRMIGEGDSAVRGYEFGGVAKSDPDRMEYAAELIRNTSPETFFSDMREAIKMRRVEGREYGDLLPFVSRERVDRGPEGIDTTYYLDPGAGGIADTVMDKLLQLGEKATDYFYPDADSKVDNYADGGVVSLKDRAVNMTRGPRSNGIMQYVPYMTGATNGY